MTLPISNRLELGSIPIPFSGCHIWIKSSVPRGYGVIHFNGRQTYTHRVAWELKHGQIPKGMSVLHRCDIPSCINPDHLFIGTQKENIRDMMEKGRAKLSAPYGDRNPTRLNPEIVRGENNGMAKLTQIDVAEIIRLYQAGEIQTKLALMFGVNQPHISRIVRGQSWGHI